MAIRTRYFKLNKTVYHGQDIVKVSNQYNKSKQGYFIVSELVKIEGGLIGKTFCKEFYDSGGDDYSLVFEAKRKSKKKEEETAKIVEAEAREYAEKFLKRFDDDSLKITGEVM